MISEWIIFGVGILNAVIGWWLLRLVSWREAVDKDRANAKRKFDRIEIRTGIDLRIRD